jgi:hypothetical protein
VPDTPSLITVDPTVQANLCGIGVGILGSGTAANCHGSQSATTDGGGGANPGLLDVSPTVQADLCGTGVGVLGVGSLANCNATQSATGGAGDGLLGIDPNVQLGVCGVGAGVLGVGTSARCSDSASSGDPGGNSGGGNSGGSHAGTGSSGGDSSFLADTAGLAVAVPADLARGSLAFTGGNPLLTGLLGIGLAGAGAVMLRLRRFGYRG